MFFNAVVKGNGKYATKGAWMAFWLGFKKLGERRVIQKNKCVSTKYIKSMLWNDLPPDQTGLRKLRRMIIGR
jgi:spore maturation protein SpmA